ncbi:M15 family metallopeptidase [Georgenia sp. SYP-B2076]|uniref:M15 family metallopeptidase n=1 Tax=Georgenia sp. SYP-B2076 TaxID=2495881 RepID=UPI001F0CBB98|nr:M15 family metallopeptidase [Georgenia sp. SYP-B2076]
MRARGPLSAAIIGLGLAVLCGCEGAGAPPTTTGLSGARSGAPSDGPTAVPPASATSPPPPPATSASPTASAPLPPPFRSAIKAVTAEGLSASWRPGCPVPVEGLRAVEVTFWGFDGTAHTGVLVVEAAVAQDVTAIMSDLYGARFPIERMEPVDLYGGDDDASMAANNTSAFNCRAVTGGSSWSEHSYGRAIDVNPLVNPYVAGAVVLPTAGTAYADRAQDAPGMIHAGDDVVRAFAARGWSWGGTWASPRDYQHFSLSGR